MENFSFEDALKQEDKALTRTCWKLGQAAKPDREKNIDSCFTPSFLSVYTKFIKMIYRLEHIAKKVTSCDSRFI